MPSCSIDLAPPAFTAPCRNQIDDVPDVIASAMPTAFLRFFRKNGAIVRVEAAIDLTTLFAKLQFWQAVDDGGQGRMLLVAR